MRVYGLDLDTLLSDRPMRPTAIADLTANLPDGSMLWRAMGLPNAWTVGEHLTATLVDQMNMWMWGNADRRRRGPRPTPIPRPGRGKKKTEAPDAHPSDGREHSSRHIGVQPMTVDQLDRFMAQDFTTIDIRRKE